MQRRLCHVGIMPRDRVSTDSVEENEAKMRVGPSNWRAVVG